MTATQAAAGEQPRLSFGLDDEPPSVASPDALPTAEMLRAVRLAEKCFEIARRSVYPAEREAAISRGIAIAKKAKLRLKLFDIPGRDEKDLQDALHAASSTQKWWASSLNAGDDETIYDAKRRAFDEAVSAAAERDRQAGRRTGPALDREALRREALLNRWPSWGAAVNALRARRVEVVPSYQPTATLWHVPGRAAGAIDEWQLRELADEVCG